ncbi:MAG: 23S rRNA methyltransferase [Actinomycetota bacterium]|nr:23S rRNA methyltransferase [Actinomycetota bacterium]
MKAEAAAEVARLLRCPHCAGPLAPGERVLVCPNRHSFDLARQGYVNLVPAPGDTAAMVSAREAFLAAGHFDFVTAALAGRTPPGVVVDAGAGPGHHLAGVLGPSGRGLALDSSPAALRRAARAHPRVGAVGCDLWAELPVRSGIADALLSVFSPRNGAEFARVLAPGGLMLAVSPAPEHLAELIAGLGLLSVGERKRERLERALCPFFRLEARERHERMLALTHEDALQAARMGPSAWHLEPGELEGRVSVLREPLTVTAAVELSVWSP